MKLRFGSKYGYGIACTASKFEEQCQWMIDTFGDNSDVWEYRFTTFWFVNEADAMLFELRWSK